jgi:iron complex outermembrane receptor protein
MTSDINIRGFGKGTLVMINGNPINLNNKYVIDAIPTESIERIEVVKGGGSVLYGSEAMGGVVNIILKKEGSNYVTVGAGNYGQRKAAVGVGNDKFHVNYNWKRWGRIEDLSVSARPIKEHKKSAKGVDSGTYDYNLVKNDKRSLDIGYNITDKLSIGYNHWESDVDYRSDWASDQIMRNIRSSYTKEDLIQLNYIDKSFKGHIWYNQNNISYGGYDDYTTSKKKPGPAERTQKKARVFGVDLQKDFKLSEKSLLTVGTNYQYEYYSDVISSGNRVDDEKSRNIYSLFAQWDQKLGDKDSFILGGRGTWTTGALNDQNYHDFSGSFQYLHKFDDNQSVYVKAAQSFIMPSFGQMYPSGFLGGSANPDLKPQKGTHYELGYKAVKGNYTWKAALFHMKVKDNITATVVKGVDDIINYQYKNEDFRNTGFELGVEAKASDKLDWNLAFLIHNPENKAEGVPGKLGWQKKFGRYQITGGVNYHIGKFRAAFTGSYVGGRWVSPSSYDSYRTKPYFLTSLTAAYAPTKNHEINLVIDNVLDRRDNLSNTMSDNGAYFTTGTNFLLSYTYKF